MALYIPLFVMSALQIGVSNVATELAYINPSITLICTVVAAFLNLLLSNVAFSLFAVDRSKETVQPARTPPVYLLASTVPLQISGALLIYLVHLIISAIVVFASLASSQLGVLCSLVVAVIVTLLSASFVFVLIEDADVEQRGLRGIRFAPRYIMRSVTVLRSSWREIARPATLLVAWNLHWIAYPQVLIMTTLPVVFQTFLTTLYWRNVIFAILMFPVCWLIWRPFYKIYEKQCIEEEAAAEAAELAAQNK